MDKYLPTLLPVVMPKASAASQSKLLAMYTIRPRKQSVSLELIERFQQVTPSALGHLIDEGAMDGGIKSLKNNVTIVGCAATVQTRGRDSIVCHKIIDLIEPGDIIVVDRCGDRRYSCWGEMTTLAAQIAGAGGVIIDGPVTDVQVLRNEKIPIFCRGTSVLTTQFLELGGSINLPVVCGGVVVNPGDLIFGDDNGIIAIKPDDAERWITMALSEENTDRNWRSGLLAGKRPSQMAPIDEIIQKCNHCREEK